MDIGTTIIVIQEVYRATAFIRGVVSDIKAMESVKKEIQDKLEHEIFFLVAFKHPFFDKKDVPMRSDRVHEYLKRDVSIILMSLKRTLAEYEIVAAKQGLLSEDISPKLENQAEAIISFSARVMLKVKDVKRTVDWALFDKEKLFKTLIEYSEWTGRLQQTMPLVLLTLASLGKFPLEGSVRSGIVKEVGLQGVVKASETSQQQSAWRFWYTPWPHYRRFRGLIRLEYESGEIWGRVVLHWGSPNGTLEVRHGTHSGDRVQVARFGQVERAHQELRMDSPRSTSQ